MDTDKMTDNELMALTATGNEKAFRALFDRYYTPLTLFADRYLDDTEQAVDTVQNFFIALYEQARTLEIKSVKAFFYQSVRNRCLNEIKHRKVRMAFESETLAGSSPTGDSHDVEDQIFASELEAKIAAIINTLSPQCKRVFEMSRFEEIPNAEIAEQLGISKRTVETHITKALSVLRKNLGENFGVYLLIYQFITHQ